MASYTEDDIKSLDWKEHIRLRPGMYIGKLADGSSPEDGIYILLKEIILNLHVLTYVFYNSILIIVIYLKLILLVFYQHYQLLNIQLFQFPYFY